MKKLFFLSLILVFIYAANTIGAVQIKDNIYNVRDYGAVGDGKILNTQAIQKAIEACAEAGGGTVYFPSGTYKAGSLYLKSNITFFISTGATLLGSKNMKDYDESEHLYGSRFFFLYGRNVKNVSIVGGGKIDGNMALDNGGYGPLAVIFEHSENILIRDVDIINSAGTAPCIHYSNHVDIIRVNILNSFGAGITATCCVDLLIDGVLVDNSTDDPIVLKNEKNEGGPGSFGYLTKDVIITNTTIRNTSHGAIKIGTGTAGVFRDIVVNNCTFENTGPMFLIELMRPKKKETTERLIENIIFSNITLRNVERMFRWTSMDVNRPIIRNISINNIIADGVHTPSVIYGLPEAPISDLTFSNIKVTYRGDPAPYWLKARYVNGMKLNNVQLQLGSAIESALVYENGERLELNAMNVQGISGNGPVIKLNQVKGAYIHNMQPPEIETFLYAEGDKTEDISLVGNDFSEAKIPFDASGEVKEGKVFPKAEKISFSNLEVTKEISSNEGFEVNVILTNTGETGAFKADVYVGGKVACSKWLWLETGENRTVTLITPKYFKPQRYEIRTGHLTTTAKVKPTPAAFESGEIVQINSPATAGELTMVTVLLKNIGGTKGTKEVKLYADDKAVASKNVTLAPGEEKEVTVEHKFKQAGPYKLKIADFPVWFFSTFANTEAHFYQTRKGVVIKAAGGPKSSTSDEDKYGTVYMKMKGAFVCTVKLISQKAANSNSNAGLMVRNDISQPAKSPGYVVLYRRPKYAGSIDWRGDLDGNGLTDVISFAHGIQGRTFPMWLKIEKAGKSFVGYSSRDGSLWQKAQIQTTAIMEGKYEIPFTNEIQDVGMYVNDKSATDSMSRVEFQDFKIEQRVPAMFQNLTISKTTVGINEPVSISATITNTGSVQGPVKAGLYIDGHEPFCRWIDLKPGESRVEFFELSPAEIQKALWYVVLPGYISGTHEITIGTAPSKTITVTELKENNAR